MSERTYKIAVIPGDGTGPEVIRRVSRFLSQQVGVLTLNLNGPILTGEEIVTSEQGRLYLRVDSRNLKSLMPFILVLLDIQTLNLAFWKRRSFKDPL